MTTDNSTPGQWFVRKRHIGGELQDCFVAAPDCQGLPYDAEILGDDEYREEAGGVARKLADCELIVKAVTAYREAPQAAVVAKLLRECELFLRVLGLESEPAAKLAADARAALGTT